MGEGKNLKRKIIGILICTLLITGFLGSTVSANIKIETERFDMSNSTDRSPGCNTLFTKIMLSEDEIDQLSKLINNIEDNEVKEAAQKIIDRVITNNGELDVEELKSVLNEYYASGKNTEGNKYKPNPSNVGPAPPSEPVQLDKENFSYPENMVSYDIGVSFHPPYTDSYCWGENVGGDHTVSANANSGALGVYANGWVGGACCEAVQKLTFYVGKTKNLWVTSNNLRVGGASTIGFAFADLKTTIHCINWDNYYEHIRDISIPFDSAEDIILFLVSILIVVPVDNIKDAILALETFDDYQRLHDNLEDLRVDGKAIEESGWYAEFTAQPGFNTVWVGYRADCGALVTGYGQGVAVACLDNIDIMRLSKPGRPKINGPSYGEPGESLEFCASSRDYYADDVQIMFDWGDGKTSSWSNFVPSEELICLSHSYDNAGEYILKAKAKDIDLMESGWSKEHKIFIGDSDLECHGEIMGFVKPSATYRITFKLRNIGQSNSGLDWEISEWPDDWGTWSFNPSSGNDLSPEDGWVDVEVTFKTPNEKKSSCIGDIKVINKNVASDWELIYVSVGIPKNKAINTMPLFLRFLENHPYMFPMLRQLLGL